MSLKEVEIISNTLSYEGLYSNHKKDPGGETWKGIARNYWPAWNGWRLLDSFKIRYGTGKQFIDYASNDLHLESDVIAFYKKYFYLPLKLKEITDYEICKEIFDTAVNCGQGTAIKCLQEACNVFNRQGKTFKDLVVDGKIGKLTIDAVNTLLKAGYTVPLLKALNCEQYIHYKKVSKKNPALETFFKGWMKRISF